MGWVQLHGQHQGGFLPQPKIGQVLSFQMQCGGFLKMLDRFIQRPPLRDDSNLQTLRDIADLVTGANHSFNNLGVFVKSCG